MNKNILDYIISEIQNNTQKETQYISHSSVGGGCINECFKISTTQETYFVKINSATKYPKMFEKEALGLKQLAEANVIRIPDVVALGSNDNYSFLVLEHINSKGQKDDFWNDFAYKLAKLHKKTSELFGLDHDNYIGSLQQSNQQHANWIDFFILERLEPLVKIAYNKRLIDNKLNKQFNILYSKLNSLIPQECPSLIHGDLWSGNFISDENGEVCIIDPAVYYGHREAEIAFTKMFGGFSHSFYEYYNDYFPLEKDWQKRIDLFNLYPALVHLILFGSSYYSLVKHNIQQYL